MNSRSSIFHNYEYTLNSLYSSVLNRVLQLKALGKIAKNRGRYFYIPSLIVSNAFQLFAPDMSMPSYKLIIVFTFDAFQGRSNVLWNRGGGAKAFETHILTHNLFWNLHFDRKVGGDAPTVPLGATALLFHDLRIQMNWWLQFKY